MDVENGNMQERSRNRRENANVIIDVAVKSSRQLFNERDPSPFRERDLDENFVTYILSSIQEFPLNRPMKLRIFIQDESDTALNKVDIQHAVRAYFSYESKITDAKLTKRLRVGCSFLLLGVLVLFACLGIAQFLTSMLEGSKIVAIIREGFVIIGWVAMWRPIEVVLYDWWPLREERLYLAKISEMPVEVLCSPS